MKYFALVFSIFALVAVILLTQATHAAQTLDLEDYYSEGSDKVCIYSNGRTTVSIHKEGAGSCPSKYVKH